MMGISRVSAAGLLIAGAAGVALGQWSDDVRLAEDTSVTAPNNAWSVAANLNTVHAVFWANFDGNSEIYHMRSEDAGTHWSARSRLTNNSSPSGNPALAVSGSKVHVAWIDMRDGDMEIYYKRSTDGGANWSGDFRLTSDDNRPSCDPSIAVSGNTVHVVWTDNRTVNLPFRIYYKRSTDAGATWGADVCLSRNNDNNALCPSVAVMWDAVHVVWADARGLVPNEIYYCRSRDAGATWSPDTCLTDPDNRSSQRPSIAALNGMVHVVWEDYRHGDAEIYCKRSTDNGANWSDDCRLTSAAGASDYASVAASGNAVHVVWEDSRNGASEIYYKLSTDFGANWAPDYRLTNAQGSSQYPSVAANLHVHVLWTDLREDNLPQIYYNHNLLGNPIWFDVGCVRLIAPADTVDSGSSVVPACSVYNYGTPPVTSYSVWMRIGSGYMQRVTVSGHEPGTRMYVTFPVWNPTARGVHAVCCSTGMYGDRVTANDRRTGTVAVTAVDVGCRRLIAPDGIVDSGSVIVPACSVYNYGTATAGNYYVCMDITYGRSYYQTRLVTNHAPGTGLYVTFPSWTANERGNHRASCSTALVGDVRRTNNWKRGQVGVRVMNVGCSRLIAPSGSIDSGTVVTPACSVHNYGNSITASYTVRMKIGPSYNQTVTVTNHYPLQSAYVTFPGWRATVRGSNVVSCSTELTNDMRRENDKATGTVFVHGVGAVGETTVILPAAFALGPVEPTPFTTMTTVRYALPRRSRVELAVFGASGELVRTLAAAEEPAGSRQVVWNGRDQRGRPVGAGIYYCRLKAGTQILTEKLVKSE